MKKPLVTAEQVTAEIDLILDSCKSNPSRSKVAAQLNDLADRVALLPDPDEEPIGEGSETFSVSLVAKLLMELGRLSIETSRAIRGPEADHAYLLNNVFLPAAVDKLFMVARKTRNTQLMTTLRRLMAAAEEEEDSSDDTE